MFCFADKNDFSALCDLWKISFGDTDEYILNFLNRRFTDDNTAVFKEDGAVVSVLFLLDGKMRIGKKTHPARYIYAACTHPNCRGRGLMSQLIEFAAEKSAQTGYEFLCLTPAEPSLFGYYSRCGFVTSFVTKRARVDRKTLASFAGEFCEYNPDSGEITALRNGALLKSDAFLWDENAVAYALDETLYTGGKAVFVGKDSLEGYAFYHERNGAVYVKEILANNYADVFAALLEKSEGDEFVIDFCRDVKVDFENIDVFDKAMLRPLVSDSDCICGNVQGYMGLTLE